MKKLLPSITYPYIGGVRGSPFINRFRNNTFPGAWPSGHCPDSVLVELSGINAGVCTSCFYGAGVDLFHAIKSLSLTVDGLSYTAVKTFDNGVDCIYSFSDTGGFGQSKYYASLANCMTDTLGTLKDWTTLNGVIVYHMPSGSFSQLSVSLGPSIPAGPGLVPFLATNVIPNKFGPTSAANQASCSGGPLGNFPGSNSGILTITVI